ncbi:MAG: TetR/AcrR family transcriptional regulator [Spirochaetes bacterium]|nr:TetR/AcrR family transcriptional regulator [Spirochaetota bacterium]
MPKITRSDEEIEQIREQILDCALAILETDGFEGLSMNRIGSRMSMTAANLYNYYGSKNELLIAIHKKTFGMLHDKLMKDIATADDPREKAIKLMESFVDFGTNNVNIYDIMFNRPIPQHSDYIGTQYEEMSLNEFQHSLRTLVLAYSVVRDFLESRNKAGGRDPQYVTIKVMSELHGIISLYNSRILMQVVTNTQQFFDTIIEDTLATLERD